MSFGFFDDEHREYVITRPDTPLPWINYLGSEDYFGMISNTAGGYSFYQDARLRRLTRYRYNNVPQDRGGRYMYLRDAVPVGITGHPPGSRHAAHWKHTLASTAWAIPPSIRPRQAFRHPRYFVPWAKISRSGSLI